MFRFDDFEHPFHAIDMLRRHMDQAFEEVDRSRSQGFADAERMWTGRFPHLSLSDTGAALVLEADVPGLGEGDVQLSIHQDVLTISGERKQDTPEGTYVHRQERMPVKFSRSLTLPCKVDAEKSTAALKNGVLTVTLTKAVEAQPRPIHVKSV